MTKLILEEIAELQISHPGKIVLAGALAFLILGTGLPSIQLETDFQDSLPDDLPPIETQEKVEANFGAANSIIILFQIDDSSLRESSVGDTREPDVIDMLSSLERELESEPIVEEVDSPASLFNESPESQDEVEEMVKQGGASFYNRDFTGVQMFVDIEEEMTEENIRKATQTINENIERTPIEPGLDVTVTGNPVIRTDIGDTMIEDSVTTIAAASLLILALLIVARGRIYGPITFVPLFMGLVWTLGTMGHLGIPLTIATIALGAMILGLGVEYGSFITERILEEKEKKGSVEAGVKEAVPTTGLAILGSSTTTIVGFSALLIASISFIRNLGLTLALGIGLTVTSALVVTPALIVKYERWKR